MRPIWYGFVSDVSFNVQLRELDREVSDDARNIALVEVRLTQAGIHADEPVTLLPYSTGKDIIIRDVLLLLIWLASCILNV